MSIFKSIVYWLLPDPIIPEYISEEVLIEVLNASQDQLPNEFLALLVAEHSSKVELVNDEPITDSYIINSYYVIPGTTSNPTQASLKSHNVPVSGKVVGSFHSHPNGVLKPSDEDMNMFQKYPVNIISGPPFNINSWRVFDNKGEPISLSAIQTKNNLANDFDF